MPKEPLDSPAHEDLTSVLLTLHDAALKEVIDAVRAKLAAGQAPQRAAVPEVSVRENGMPSISDAPIFSRNGPLEYCRLLDPPWGDDEARAAGKYPRLDFPAMHALQDFIVANPEASVAYGEAQRPIIDIFAQFAIEKSADAYFRKFGNVESDEKTRGTMLRKLYAGLFREDLEVAIVIPIALTHFEFERFPLNKQAYIIKMSKALQQVRWDGKAYGASGHSSVLASATHALVLTGWSIPNRPHLSLGQALAAPTREVSELVGSFFAVLRLETGIDTGYAQELRLSRGWRVYETAVGPEVHAVGARRYPIEFDNFGWIREVLPTVTKAQMEQVRETWNALKTLSSKRVELALRRLNAAMTRDDAADTILDATIALEILLGDGDGQAISYKLRMRAAALRGLTGTKVEMEAIRKDMTAIYTSRSAIVHGVNNKQSRNEDHQSNARLAVETLRIVIKALTTHPRFLDPLVLDSELLLFSASTISTPAPSA